MKTIYKHIGYYNDKEDVKYLLEDNTFNADKVVNYYLEAKGNFYTDTDFESFWKQETALIVEEEEKTWDNSKIQFTQCHDIQNLYIVTTDGTFIDIYKFHHLEDEPEEICDVSMHEYLDNTKFRLCMKISNSWIGLTFHSVDMFLANFSWQYNRNDISEMNYEIVTTKNIPLEN